MNKTIVGAIAVISTGLVSGARAVDLSDFFIEKRTRSGNTVTVEYFRKDNPKQLVFALTAVENIKTKEVGDFTVNMTMDGEVRSTVAVFGTPNTAQVNWTIDDVATSTVMVKDQKKTKAAIHVRGFCEESIVTFEIGSDGKPIPGTIDGASGKIAGSGCS